jgi:carbon monoxide dehydrogenase subunit G
MEFDNSFEVPLPPPQAWAVLMDIQGIAPCMPGAELTEVIDAATYKGRIAVRLGPVALTFAGIVKFEDIDASNYTAKVKAQGSDAKGRGGAHAEASFRLEPIADGSRVLVHTNLTLSGAVAQYGRGVGIIQSTAGALIQQFADCLKTRFVRPEFSSAAAAESDSGTVSVSASEPTPIASKPISGLSLLVQVLWERIRRLFTR